MPDLQLLGHPQQMPLPDQMRPQLRQMPFLKFGETMKQSLRGDQSQHGVSQKLKHLVVAARCAIARAQRLHLARLRTVSQRLLQQFGPLEAVTDAFFERNHVA